MMDSLPYRNDAAIVLRRLIRSLPRRFGVGARGLGRLGFVVVGQPLDGRDRRRVGLRHGDVRDFLICDKAKAESAKFVMSGDYVRWKQVAKKEVDSTKALMQGKLKLKGDLTYVVRNIKTVNKVIDLLCEIETLWPDEV